MTLCQACQSIDIRDLLESLDAFSASDREVSYCSRLDYLGATENYQPHHGNFAALRAAAKSGCDFCSMIVFHHHETALQEWTHEDPECDCTRFLGPVRLAAYQDKTTDFVLLVVFITSKHKRETHPAYIVAEFEICVAKGASIPYEDTHLTGRLSWNELPQDLGSEKCLAMGTAWLNNCLQHHPECRAKAEQQPPSVLPTRVIDVGSASQQPFLHVSGGDEVGEWVALSYCWGGDSPITLTAATLARLQRGLPLDDFPPTLRDAVIVARALGVRYIWVDALCILQDDAQDWAAEASRMAKVYERAALTIAAASAESVGDGFLGRRYPHFHCAFPWRRRKDPSDTDLYPILLRGVLTSLDAEMREWESRWASRGWTFQEQLLSTRLLCYTTGRMIWHCAEGQAIEPSERVRRPLSSLFADLKDLLAVTKQADSGVRGVRRPYDVWYFLMHEYSQRQLTFGKDRLPAIAALARTFQAQQPGEYIAGLWREDLVHGLLWRSVTQADGSGRTAKPLRYAWLRYVRSSHAHDEETNVNPVGAGAGSEMAAAESHGPSWSWIDTCFGSLAWPIWSERLTYHAKVTDVSVTRVLPDNVFGAITGGELVLEAPYRNISLNLGIYAGSLSNPLSIIQRSLSRFGSLSKTRELAHIVLTRPESLISDWSGRSIPVVPPSAVDFTLVLVAESSGERRPQIFILVLQRQRQRQDERGGAARGRGVYRRVAQLGLQPWEHDGENSIAKELTNELEGEAYEEVAREEWPTGTFVIV